MFRGQVGEVTYVEMFSDEKDKPRGCGIMEFATKELAKQAVEKMHRYDLKGRKLVVKEDFDVERDKTGRIIKGAGVMGSFDSINFCVLIFFKGSPFWSFIFSNEQNIQYNFILINSCLHCVLNPGPSAP